jgi:hypothetical protein
MRIAVTDVTLETGEAGPWSGFFPEADSTHSVRPENEILLDRWAVFAEIEVLHP